VPTAVQVEMQRRHLYIARHAAKAANAAAAYRAKHGIVDTVWVRVSLYIVS
jgi:hypothetical protein